MTTDGTPLHDIARPTNRIDLPIVSLDEAHAPNKVLAHPDLLRRFVADQEIRPVHLRIGIMGACNMRCNFCNFHSPNEENFYDLFSFKDSIKTDQAVRLLQQFAEAEGRAVTFCGSGECTIHPGYVTICTEAAAAGLRIGLITNGSRLKRPAIADCVAATHTWVRIGMNAGSEATFNAITHDREHTFASFLSAAGAIRERAVDPDFRIGFNYVITAENHHEIRQAARLAADSGAHYIRFEPEFYSGLGHETIETVLGEVAEALDDAAALADERFEVSIPKLDRGPMDQVEQVEGDFEHCHYSRFVTAIGADGHLYPCPQVHLNSRYRIGNVLEDGYQHVLDGGPRAEWEASNPNRTDLCKSCFYRPQNELLELLHRGQIGLEDALSSYRFEIPSTLHADFV